MESSSFGADRDINDLIKKKTKAWRYTWIIPVLDEVIEEIEGEINKRRLHR